MTFEEDFPSLKKYGKTNRDRVIGNKVISEWMWSESVISDCCLDKQKVEKAIAKAVLGVNFKGYDNNSEKALIEMQKYIHKELKLE